MAHFLPLGGLAVKNSPSNSGHHLQCKRCGLYPWVWKIPWICSVAKFCPVLCSLMNCSMPGFSVFHYLPEFAQTHVHWATDAIQSSHPLSPPSLLLLPSILPSIRVFSNEHSGLIHFRIDWFGLLAVQGTLKSLHHICVCMYIAHIWTKL